MSSSEDPGTVWTAAARCSCWRSMPACLRPPDAANLSQHEHLVSTRRTRTMFTGRERRRSTPAFLPYHDATAVLDQHSRGSRRVLLTRTPSSRSRCRCPHTTWFRYKLVCEAREALLHRMGWSCCVEDMAHKLEHFTVDALLRATCANLLATSAPDERTHPDRFAAVARVQEMQDRQLTKQRTLEMQKASMIARLKCLGPC